MDSVTGESIAAECDYCGRENPDRLTACTGCGKPLGDAAPESDAESEGKSKRVAVCLALLLGPLGLIYVEAWGMALIMFLAGLSLRSLPGTGLYVTVGVRIIAAIIAYNAAAHDSKTPDVERDSSHMLDEAARLESEDRDKAIAAYEEIIRSYPNTRASEEAARNIATLKRSG
jgi:hypothetical protein